MSVHEHEINIVAFAIAILKPEPLTVEQAFEIAQSGKPKLHSKQLTDEDTLDMIELRKQGLSWVEIDEIYNLTETAAFKRVKKYREKVDKYEASKKTKKVKLQEKNRSF